MENKKKCGHFHLIIFTCFGILLLNAGCTGPEKIVYLYNSSDSQAEDAASVKTRFEQPIGKNDLLSIFISSLNPDDMRLLNAANGGYYGGQQTGIQQQGGSSGYLVDQDGEIKLPLTGTVKAEGLTRKQLEKVLEERLKDYTKDPIVNIRFLNAKVTVMGDVASPREVVLPTERLTVLEAIGAAGDLTVTARRDNVMIIREDINGKRRIGRIDLTSANLFNSPFFYLQRNDVIYVEPVQAKYVTRGDKVSRYIGLASGVLSLFFSVLALSRH